MSVSILYDEHGNVTSVALSEFDPDPDDRVYVVRMKRHEAAVCEPLEVALWIRKTKFPCTPTQALYMAHCLIKGEAWRPRMDQAQITIGESPWFDIQIEDGI